ncbi:MAG: SDR family oxidoreductase [Bacilli bacterium]|nr:SDR family oxidoreductase [Bacilli bacterium]
MKILITGASSGIGLEMAKYLAKKKHELILVARSKEKLEQLQQQLATKTTIIATDLSVEQKVKELYIVTRKDDIDVLINNAGFGICDNYDNIPLSKELEMIDTNIKAVQILTKSYLRDMLKKDSGYILNVSSIAGLQPGGPLMSSYYASKSYIYSLTNGINCELKKKKSKVHVACLCPGPVSTNFNEVAGVKFSIKSLSAKYVAKYAIDELLNRKSIIIPGFKMKLMVILEKILPTSLILNISYKIQRKKF